MELTFYGANCLRIATKKAQIVIDDNLASLGLKPVTKADDISLRTLESIPVPKSRFDAHVPGEYEISGMVIHGIGARAHMDPVRSKSSKNSADSTDANRTSNGMDKEGETNATVFTIQSDDTKIAVLGHIYPDLSEEQLEQIGEVDIVVVPVGNSGYTMDGIGALKVIKQIEPKVVIPTHYADKAIKYEVPQVELEEGLKGLAMEASETLDKYKPKITEMTDTTKLIVLERQ